MRDKKLCLQCWDEWYGDDMLFWNVLSTKVVTTKDEWRKDFEEQWNRGLTSCRWSIRDCEPVSDEIVDKCPYKLEHTVLSQEYAE